MNSCAWSGIARSARKMVASRLSSSSFDQAAEPTAPDVILRSREDGEIRVFIPGSCAQSRVNVQHMCILSKNQADYKELLSRMRYVQD